MYHRYPMATSKQPPRKTGEQAPKVLHVERFPADLLWRIKTKATSLQQTTRDFVIETLEAACAKS